MCSLVIFRTTVNEGVCSLGDAVAAAPRAVSAHPDLSRKRADHRKVSELSKQTNCTYSTASFSAPLKLAAHLIIMDGVPTPLRCFNEFHSAEMFVDDGVESVTSVEQVSGGTD